MAVKRNNIHFLILLITHTGSLGRDSEICRYQISFISEGERKEGRERERERWPDPGWMKAGKWELNAFLTRKWQECNYLNHHLLPHRVCISRKLESVARDGN